MVARPGLMTMAAGGPDGARPDVARATSPCATSLRTSHLRLGAVQFLLSMGMSGDFEIAIEEGANIVRVGSAIFGEPLVPDPPDED